MHLKRDRGTVHIVVEITISLRSTGRSLIDPSGHSYDSEPHAPCDTPQTSSTIPGLSGSSAVILSQKEYDRLCQPEFSQNGHLATHALSLGRHAYTALP